MVMRLHGRIDTMVACSWRPLLILARPTQSPPAALLPFDHKKVRLYPHQTMEAEPASPSRSIPSRLAGALSACRDMWSHASKLALDVALPTLCVACREPV